LMADPADGSTPDGAVKSNGDEASLNVVKPPVFVDPPSGPDVALEDLWGSPASLGLATPVLGGWAPLFSSVHVKGGDAEMQRFREMKCFPATVAWSLLQLPAALLPAAPHDRPVVVWILGARTTLEGQLAKDGEWRLLADVFPELSWELVLVGPEMDDLGGCIPADGGLGRVQACGVRLKGHEWVHQPPPDSESEADRRRRQPDFVVLFNSGVGSLTLGLVRHWLETVADVLQLSVPVLFTCFSEKEMAGEDLMVRQLFKAKVLVDFLDNPLKSAPGDAPPSYGDREDRQARLDQIEPRDGDSANICNHVVWWAQGSTLTSEELHEAATVSGMKLLKSLTQHYAVKQHPLWIQIVGTQGQSVGGAALEMLSAASEHPQIVRLLARQQTKLTNAVVSYTKRHGTHVEARPCLERVLLAMVLAKMPDLDPAMARESVQQIIDEKLGPARPAKVAK